MPDSVARSDTKQVLSLVLLAIALIAVDQRANGSPGAGGREHAQRCSQPLAATDMSLGRQPA